tara:strand:+ start:508 stop:2331 length:1824 start_codon:yes stop_codon:yes gene_type:complete
MCGITAIISKKSNNIIELLLDSIHQLENRGYDSTGIAYINDDIQIYKRAMLNNYNFYKFNSECKDIISNIGIAHTRWATHGGITDDNAHPHLSYNKLVCVIHNGIIENYDCIKRKLILKGIKFQSDTDTEVICNLLDYYISLCSLNITEAIEKIIKKLQGTYGLVILYKDEPDRLYVVRNGSPILIGENDNNIMITSEISGFVKQVNNYICLENHDIAVITRDGFNTVRNYEKREIKNDICDTLTPDPYKYWMLKEIYEQKYSILRSMNNGGRLKNDIIKLGGIDYLKPLVKYIKNIILLGCGTSLNACMIGKYYFKLNNNINNIQCIDGADFSVEDIPKDKYTLIIFCSQSGETKDLYRCLELCSNQKNIVTLGVINVVDSLIAREVNCGVYLNAGREVAVASTKSFTSMLCILSMISIWMHQEVEIFSTIYKSYLDNIRKLPTNISNLLDLLDINYYNDINIDKLNHNSLFILGKGKMEAVAKEGALKIKEICYIHAEGCSASSLKHGPFALLCEDFPVILLVDRKNKDKLMNTYKELCARKAYVLIITEIRDIVTDNIIYVPENKYYQEIIYTIMLQYIAYKLSIKREINPDKPRNLAKVVTVE